MLLLERLVLSDTDRDLSTFVPDEGSGEAAMQLIWPLGASFKHKLEQIMKCHYQIEYEPLADKAIEEFVFENGDWSLCSVPVLTILYERFTQFCTMMIAHAKTNTSTFLPPAQLSDDAKRKFLVLFWLYEMTLPYPVADGAFFEPGQLFPNPSGTRH